MIIKDKSKLKVKCELVSSLEEGEEISAMLFKELVNSKIPGIGLAANQIGINKRVCVLNVKEPVVLINPKIVEKSEEKFAFIEGCLSFPGDTVKTQRYKWVKVQADNHNQTLYFSVWDNKNDDDEEQYIKTSRGMIIKDSSFDKDKYTHEKKFALQNKSSL